MQKSKRLFILWFLIAVLLSLNFALLYSVFRLRASARLSHQREQSARLPSTGRPHQQPIRIVREDQTLSPAQLVPPVEALAFSGKLSGLSPLETQQKDTLNTEMILDMLVSRPNIQDVPILDEADFKKLLRRRDKIPLGVPDELLMIGDIDSVLQNERWNPLRRELSPEERTKLAVLLNNYRFYTSISRREILNNDILPLVDSMRAAGEYIEHPSDQPPPIVEGVKIVHSESTKDHGTNRYYYFFPEENPDLYHAYTVQEQQSLKNIVEIYEHINGRNSD